MRILFVIHCYPPESLGGSEIYTAHLAKELAARHEVSVFARAQASGEKPGIRKEVRGACQIYWVHQDPAHASDFQHAYDNKLVDRWFSDVVRSVEPDLIHIQGVWSLSNNLPLVARGHGLPVVFTLHDFWLMCPRGQRLRPSDLSVCWEIDLARCAPCLAPWIAPPRTIPASRLRALFRKSPYPLPLLLKKIYRRVLRPPALTVTQDFSKVVALYHDRTREIIQAVDLFIAPSQFLRQEFIRYGVPPTKIVYSDYGMDIGLFDATAKVPSDSIRFGFVGALIPSKGAHVLVEAFQGLEGNAQLLVFGVPPPWDWSDYSERLHRMRRDPRIRFMGSFSPDRVAEAFSQIDILVIPSLWFENSPLTIKEAFLSKTPVIASRLGGMAEYVKEGFGGLLFAPGDLADLRDTMLRIIREPDLLVTLRAGIPPVKAMKENAVELEQIYENVRMATGGNC